MYHACENERCRVLLFTVGGTHVIPTCPTCWNVGTRLDDQSLDALLRALDKRVSPEQLTLEEAFG